MDEERRRFILKVAAIAGAAVTDRFGILKSGACVLPSFRGLEVAEAEAKEGQSLSSIQPSPEITKPSKDIKDYPHITDVIPSKDIGLYFPVIVEACSDPKTDYLSEIPFIVELEVCKTWKESLFEWTALSNSGAAGLQQLMEVTAREDMGLTVVSSPELKELNSAISEHSQIQRDIATKRQELYRVAESGTGDITESAIVELNRLRSELVELNKKRETAYQRLKSAKSAYVAKIRSMSMDELRNFDSRFVPEIAIPAGLKYIVKNIVECMKFFGGSVEMNVWRGVAAYNSGLQRTKDWKGLPYIRETVEYTRDILSNLTRMLELKRAYSTGDANLIEMTKRRIGL